MGTPAKVGVVLVNYHAFEHLAVCLDSLRAMTYDDYFVVVVDNETGGDAALLAERYPEVELLPQVLNLGFSGGCNVGIGQALNRGADHVLLLNIDTTVPPGILTQLVPVLDDETIGACAPMMVDFDEPDRVAFGGATMDYKGRCDYLHVGERLEAARQRENYDVPFLHGAAILIRGDVLATVGLFDERYFLNYEDIDFCARVRAEGYRLVMVTSAWYAHKGNVTIGVSSLLGQYYLVRNRLLYLADHRQWRRLGPALAAAFVHSRRDPDLAMRKVTRNGLNDFVHGRFGRRPIGVPADDRPR